MHAIEIKNVSKKFREEKKEIIALDNVSLNINKGEIFGLLGPNGAGKTTLLNIIINILLPDSGYVKVFGKDVNKNRDVIEKMNFVSGDARFHWNLTVRDVLNFYARSYRLSDEERKRKIKELTEFFGIINIMKRKFGYLSTGEAMRLIFCKALLNTPELLLFDEPTVGLDPDMAIKLRGEIKRINKELETTILLTTHYMYEAEQLSHRIAFIYNGRIIDIGSVESVKLRKFSTYDVIIKVKKILNRNFLEKKGFAVKGKEIRRSFSQGEDVSEVLSLLSENGYKITGIETKKPTLEDYFIKMLEEKNENKVV